MPVPRDLPDDPEYLPFKLDPARGLVLYVRVPARQRAEAAFLDERLLDADSEGAWLPMAMLASSMPPPTGRVDFIFHVGHCGSTLLSRLLQAWPEVQALREPLPLRTLAELRRAGPEDTGWRALGDALLGAWTRTLPPQERTLIKATSSSNDLAGPLLQRSPRAKALLLDQPLRPWLATVFKSEASIRDVMAGHASRVQWLRSVPEAATMPAPESPFEACAMAWLVEQLRFAGLQRAWPGRVRRVDFEALLATPRPELATIATFMELAPEGVEAALRLPAWQRYSKAEQQGYGSADREHDLRLARQRFARELEAAGGWARTATRRWPEPLAAALRERMD